MLADYILYIVLLFLYGLTEEKILTEIERRATKKPKQTFSDDKKND